MYYDMRLHEDGTIPQHYCALSYSSIILEAQNSCNITKIKALSFKDFASSKLREIKEEM